MGWANSVDLRLSKHMKDLAAGVQRFYSGDEAGAEWVSYDFWDLTLNFMRLRKDANISICPQARITRIYDGNVAEDDASAPDPEDTSLSFFRKKPSGKDEAGMAKLRSVGAVTRRMTKLNIGGGLVPEVPSGQIPAETSAAFTTASADYDKKTPAPPESKPEKYSKSPDFASFYHFVLADSEDPHVLVHSFWEMKGIEVSDLDSDPWSDHSARVASQTIKQHLPQLAAQAQHIFQHFPRQDVLGGYLVVGVWFRYVEFSRKRTPKLAPVGLTPFRVSPDDVIDFCVKMTEVIPVLNPKRTDYHSEFKKNWTLCLSRCQRLQGVLKAELRLA